jgi:hypothetical protein
MGLMISVTTGPSRQAPLGVSARYTVIQTVPVDHADDEEVVNSFNRITDELTFDVGPGR